MYIFGDGVSNFHCLWLLYLLCAIFLILTFVYYLATTFGNNNLLVHIITREDQ